MLALEYMADPGPTNKHLCGVHGVRSVDWHRVVLRAQTVTQETASRRRGFQRNAPNALPASMPLFQAATNVFSFSRARHRRERMVPIETFSVSAAS